MRLVGDGEFVASGGQAAPLLEAVDAAFTLLVRDSGSATGRFRLDAPWLGLADDIEGTDHLSG